MGKKEEKQKKEAKITHAETGLQRAADITQGVAQNTAARLEPARDEQDAERRSLSAAYSSFLDPGRYEALRGVGRPAAAAAGGGGGGADEGFDNQVEAPGGGGPAAPPPDPWADIKGRYGNFADTGGINYGAATQALGGFQDIAGSGGINAEAQGRLGDIRKGYEDISANPFDRARFDQSLGNLEQYGQTGGYDPARMAQMQQDIQGLRDFQSISPEQLAQYRGGVSELMNFQPGMSEADVARFRGTGFDEFARTGGYSAQDVGNIRGRVASQTPQFYKNLQADQQRRAAITGGMFPGAAASQRALARDASRGSAEAIREGEIGLAESVRAGRQYGITGLRDTEAALQGEMGRRLGLRQEALGRGVQLGTDLDLGLADRSLRAREGALQAAGQIESDVAGNRLRATESAGSQELQAQRLASENRLAALSGRRETELDPIRIQNEARLRALTGITETAQGAEEMAQKGKMFGTEGLANIVGQEQAAAAAARGGGGGGGGWDGGSATDPAALSPAQQAANERFIIESQMGALGGLGNLYGTAPGLAGQYQSGALQGAGQLADIYGGMANVARGPGKEGPSTWQRIGTGAAAAGLTAAAFYTGGATAPAAAGMWGATIA
jgi:hypothetical protein